MTTGLGRMIQEIMLFLANRDRFGFCLLLPNEDEPIENVTGAIKKAINGVEGMDRIGENTPIILHRFDGCEPEYDRSSFIQWLGSCLKDAAAEPAGRIFILDL